MEHLVSAPMGQLGAPPGRTGFSTPFSPPFFAFSHHVSHRLHAGIFRKTAP
jgi:hypothetical protein